MTDSQPVAALEMFGRTRGEREFPASWGDPPGDRYSATRANWIAANVGIELRQKARGQIGRHRTTPEEARRTLELERQPPWGPSD
jgi:hypothetical protein